MRKDTSYPILFGAEVRAGRDASSTGLEGTVGEGPCESQHHEVEVGREVRGK